MKQVHTLTLSPAFDIHCDAPNFAAYQENLVHVRSRDAGGKGVNISRALVKNGIDSTAWVAAGEENAESFFQLLAQDDLCTERFLFSGRIRENFTLHTSGKPETRISFPGAAMPTALFQKIEHRILSVLKSGDFLTLTGRLPNGIPMQMVLAMLEKCRNRGVQTVIDSRSFSADDLRAAKPWLIKPNQEEIAAYTGMRADSPEEARVAAQAFAACGIENVMLSLGKDGALLLCQSGCFYAKPPQINARSTIGAGDSSIAGFLAAAQSGAGPADCLTQAVAFGSAACLRDGTLPPLPEDVERIRSLIVCQTQ